MGLEIERKFLVRSDTWRREAVSSERLFQGYLANTARSSVRVRVAGGRAWLSVKSMTRDIVRAEYEYDIPQQDACEMLASLCEGPVLEKRRHLVPRGGLCFEVDEFAGRNAGLVVAELELDAPERAFDRPAWLGEEVTGHLRYYNFALVSEPYESWPEDARRAAAAGLHLGIGTETSP